MYSFSQIKHIAKWACINVWKNIFKKKTKPQIVSLLKFYSNSFVMSAMKTSFCLKTICVFVFGFTPHSRIVHTHGDITITGGGFQIITFIRHSWPLSSEVSWACQPTIIVKVSLPFLRLRSVAVGIRTPNLPPARRTL